MLKKIIQTPYKLRNNRDTSSKLVQSSSVSSAGSVALPYWLQFAEYNPENETIKFTKNLISEGEIAAYQSGEFNTNIFDNIPTGSKINKGLLQVGNGINVNSEGIISLDSSAVTPQTLSFSNNTLSILNGNSVDLSTLQTDLTGYYTQSQTNTLLNNKANKNGSSSENFTVKDLTIHGTVNHWLADVITVDDAKLQLNRTQGAATVASGIDIFNGTSVVSSLNYTVAGNWQFTTGDIYQGATKVALQNVSILAGNGLSGGGAISANRTITLGTPSTITNSTTNSVTSTSHTHALTVTKSDVGLGNVGNYSDFARKTITESISGFWHFNEGVSIGTTCKNNSNATRYFKIGYFTLPNQYNWGQVTIQVKTRHGANHTIFAGVERTATNVSVYRTFQVIGKVLNQTYYLVRTSANVMELWLRNIQSFDDVQISILNRSTAHIFTPDFNVSGTDALPTNESVVTCTDIINTTGSLNVSGNITAPMFIGVADDSSKLGGANADQYVRRTISQTISGLHTFSHGNIILNNGRDWRFVYDSSNFWIRNNTGNYNAFHINGTNNTVTIANSLTANRLIGINNSDNTAIAENTSKLDGYGLLMNRSASYITSTGNIHFKSNSSTHTANGNALILSGLNASFGGNITALGEIAAYQSSDKRLKSNITTINNALNIVKKLNPVQFNWNEKAVELNEVKNTESINYGVIAQEIEEVLPELIHETNGFKSVDYMQLIGILVASVKELNNVNIHLKNEMNELNNKITRLENRLNGNR